MIMEKIESQGQYSPYVEALNKSHNYFTKNDNLLASLPGFIQEVSTILQSANSPFIINPTEYSIDCISTHTDNLQDLIVVYHGKRISLKEAIILLQGKYPQLFPISLEYTTPLITDNIIWFICDIVSALNAYNYAHSKKGKIKLWKINYQGETLTYDPSQKVMIENKTKGEVTNVLHNATPEIPLSTIEDIAYYINHSSFPVRARIERNAICIDKLKAKSLKDLKDPDIYIIKAYDKHMSFSFLMDQCTIKWPSYFNDYINIKKYCSNSGTKERTKLYRAFFTGIMKMHLTQKKSNLHFMYEDSTPSGWMDDVTIKPQGTLAENMKKKDFTPKGNQTRKIHSKHKLIESEENANKVVSADLFLVLGYKKGFCQSLYDFCKENIVGNAESDFTVQTLIFYRKRLHPSIINEFNKKGSTRVFILAIDRILEYYLSDTLIGRKDRTEVNTLSRR